MGALTALCGVVLLGVLGQGLRCGQGCGQGCFLRGADTDLRCCRSCSPEREVCPEGDCECVQPEFHCEDPECRTCKRHPCPPGQEARPQAAPSLASLPRSLGTRPTMPCACRDRRRLSLGASWSSSLPWPSVSCSSTQPSSACTSGSCGGSARGPERPSRSWRYHCHRRRRMPTAASSLRRSEESGWRRRAPWGTAGCESRPAPAPCTSLPG
ncbi:tumor necrosis factor receptor superfamily member 18 isoform X2 [Dipodomys merriami]|uniref:tumor necrosis factor receptor superfamily member 18 isoform X2 n=1 Tax=Dipodomys merriami TaxID=94247 RepID=UPI0038559F46